jgi:putative membrane protein
MMNYGYYFGGMHFIWWFVWIMLLIWIFAIPYNIPGQRAKNDSPLDILKRRLASGEITKEQYQEHKKILLDASDK